jgi:hypothetical protein
MDKQKNADGCNAKSSKDTQGVTSLSRNKTKSGKLEPVEEPPDLPPLPQKWKAYKSKNRPGKLYYFNEKTGATSWQRPNSASEYSQRQTQDHPGSSKTALSADAQRKRVQKLVKIAKRSPEKRKEQTKPEVVILYEVH